MPIMPEFRGVSGADAVRITNAGNPFYPSAEQEPCYRTYMIHTPWGDARKDLAAAFVRGLYHTLKFGLSWSVSTGHQLMQDAAARNRERFYTQRAAMLRYAVARDTGSCPSTAQFHSFLESIAETGINVGPLFPSAPVPIEHATMPNLCAYQAFGLDAKVRSRPSHPWQDSMHIALDFRPHAELIRARDAQVDRILARPIAPLQNTPAPFPWLATFDAPERAIFYKGEEQKIAFPRWTDKRHAEFFLRGFEKWNSLYQLDTLTVSDIGRVDGFVDVIAQERDAKQFLDWLKDMRVVAR